MLYVKGGIHKLSEYNLEQGLDLSFCSQWMLMSYFYVQENAMQCKYNKSYINLTISATQICIVEGICGEHSGLVAPLTAM